MRFARCDSCRLQVQIGGDPAEIDNLLKQEQLFHCVTPFCSAFMRASDHLAPEGYLTVEMPVTSFFRAIHGFGSGVGAPASFERAQKLLLSQRVVQIVGEPIGQPERVLIRQLVLESGIRLHFETSARGACLYYIEEPGPTCREVVEHELSLSPNPEGTIENREEAGRAPGTAQGSCGEESDPGMGRTAERPESDLPPVPQSHSVPTSHCESAGGIGRYHGGNASDLRL